MPYLIIHCSQSPVSKLSLCMLPSAIAVVPEKQSGVAVPFRISSIGPPCQTSFDSEACSYKWTIRRHSPQSSNRHDMSSIGLLHSSLVLYREDDPSLISHSRFLRVRVKQLDAARGGTTELHAAMHCYDGDSSPSAQRSSSSTVIIRAKRAIHVPVLDSETHRAAVAAPCPRHVAQHIHAAN